MLALAITLVPVSGYAMSSLQLFVELTPSGGTLRPPPGSYAGELVINKPITLDGGGEVTLDGEGRGSILIIKADGVTVRGMHLTRSGRSHDQVDSGIVIEANDGLFEDNTIDDSLFGIHLKQANGNTVRNNLISSIDDTPSLRGEGIRMWYSHDNRIEGNQINRARDMVFANSSDNHIVNNSIKNSRIGMEFVFSPDNTVEGNRIENNDTGIVVLYSNGLKIRGNHLSHMRNVGSSAFALKESAKVVIEDNEILHCVVGVTANSPTDPENTYHIQNNHFAYNDIAMYFYGEKGGHTINDNRFDNNIIPVVVSASSSALGHHWHDNYWDTYQGFDENNDGIGDTPYEMFIYADRLWMDRPMIKFFRGSLLLSLLDFIERLTPFSSPKLILRDLSPRMKPSSRE
jgi:nitrous oxidase accessory protein